MTTAIETADTLTRFLLEHIQYTEESIQAVATSIQNGDARLVSDGSFIPAKNMATFSFIIENKECTHSISATQNVPGDLNGHDAYRAESTGILAGLMATKIICDVTRTQNGALKIGCDGKAALEKATNENWITNTRDKHHDILSKIHEIRKELKITLKPH